jgi:hypothetical protein
MAALESYFVEKPDVVLLDLVMKGMYGLEVLARLKEMDPAASHRRVRGRANVFARTGGAGWRRGFSRQAVDCQRSVDPRSLDPGRVSSAMELNHIQHEALVELLNIGFGRAGDVALETDPAARAARGPNVAIPPGHAPDPVAPASSRNERVAACTRSSAARSPVTALLLLDPIAAATLTGAADRRAAVCR